MNFALGSFRQLERLVRPQPGMFYKPEIKNDCQLMHEVEIILLMRIN
jgi:hypothetical protein